MAEQFDFTKIKARRDYLRAKSEELVKSDPWITIEFPEGKFKLEYSFGAVQEIFRVTGKNIQAGELDVTDLSDVQMFVTLLLEGLKTHQPDMTEEKLVRMMRMKHLGYYLHKIQMALEATQPDLSDMEEILGDKKDEAPVPLVEVPPS